MHSLELTDSIVAALAVTGMPVYAHADTVNDGDQLPCLLLNIEDDDLVDHVGPQAKYDRSYSMTAVYRRGATEADLVAARRAIMRALGFGLPAFERPIKGMHTNSQSTEYEFAGKGKNHTKVTITVTFSYIEDYGS